MAVLRSTSGIHGRRDLRSDRRVPGRNERGRGTVGIGHILPRGPVIRGRMPGLTRYEGVDVQFGRYYEEFEVGAVYKHWPGKTVTEYDDHLFCLITMNHHPL